MGVSLTKGNWMETVFVVLEHCGDVTSIDSVWTTPNKAEQKKLKLEAESSDYEDNYEYEVVEKKVLQ